jgi:hypothetical protein
MKNILHFSSLSPVERVSFIETLPFSELVVLRNILEETYQQNGMWEAYIIQCDKEITKRRNDKIDNILDGTI